MAKLERRRDSDGLFRFSFRYIDVDGSRRRHTPDVETEHEALRIMAEVRARIARGIVGVPDVTANERQASTITLSAMLDRWLKAAHCTSKSPDRYRSRFASNVRRIIGVLGDGPIGTIRRGDVSRCFAIWEREGAVAATRNYWISTLSRLWVWGQDAGLIKVSYTACAGATSTPTTTRSAPSTAIAAHQNPVAPAPYPCIPASRSF